MDRRIIKKDGKWRNDHEIDAEWTIFDGKDFFSILVTILS